MLKRILARRHPNAAHTQEAAREEAEGRFDYRSPEGRRLVTANRAYLALHPEWK
ncbi:hypothetical protein [Streptomyces sp. NPDC056291]|uniref:hypothetical protein n=1 Tax=Streptomyces sp. NPDC056291 TaxID=3345772 RepID=UPI0035DAF17E